MTAQPHLPGGIWMLCTLGCAGEACGSLGASIWVVIPGAPAADMPRGLGAVMELGAAAAAVAGCGADWIIVVGGSALMMCEPALTGCPLFTGGFCMPIPV